MAEVVILRGQRHEIYECITCGVLYSCPEVVMNEQRAEGGYHYCSNGHCQGWSKEKCERERLRLERDRLVQKIAQKDDEIAFQIRQREEAEKSEAKLKRRAKAGICPCCNRSFVGLARHIKTKHPAFGEKPQLRAVS